VPVCSLQVVPFVADVRQGKMHAADVGVGMVAGQLEDVAVGRRRLVKLVVHALQIPEHEGSETLGEDAAVFLAEGQGSLARLGGPGAVSLQEAGERQGPVCRKLENQVVGGEVLKRTASLRDHGLRVIAGDRQRGPSAGDLPDQVAGMGI